MRQRNILKRMIEDMDKRIDHVHYMRGGSHSKDALFIEHTQFRRDGSGVTVKLTFDPDGYCSGTMQSEVKT